MLINSWLIVGKENSGKYILNTYFKFSRNSSFSWSVPEKSFYRNDAGSLKQTESFLVGGFKSNCWGLL